MITKLIYCIFLLIGGFFGSLITGNLPYEFMIPVLLFGLIDFAKSEHEQGEKDV
jgi:hypothetical protein